MTDLIPRHRVSWRKVGKGNRSHAVLLIARGRLAFGTLCGRTSVGSKYAPDLPECDKCAEQLEPLYSVRVPAA
jgi:hypothetical protein